MIVLSLILLLTCIFVTGLYLLALHAQKELSKKIALALNGDTPIKVAINGSTQLQEIAAHFNTSVQHNLQLRHEIAELDTIKEERVKLHGTIAGIENTLNQLNLIGHIGQRITAKLNIHDIIQEVSVVIQSSTRVSEIHYLFDIGPERKRLHYMSSGDATSEMKDEDWLQNNIVEWCYNNKRDMWLQDAISDFAQYVHIPVVMYNGKAVHAAAGIHFNYQNLIQGCIVVFSDKKNEFDTYLTELIKSMSTYFAVALENATLYEDLSEEKKRSEDLLLNILPKNVAQELQVNGYATPRFHPEVTVMFTDFKNFTNIAGSMESSELVKELHFLFGLFDAVMEKYGIEKIKTIGDAYMCVSGLNNEEHHATQMINAAIDIHAIVDAYKQQREQLNKPYFEIRIGLHTGSVVSGVVGKLKFAFDIWGDTVNTAARMEQKSEPGKINISESTFEKVSTQFECEYRGMIDVKNKGEVSMYFVTRPKQLFHAGK